MKKLVKLGLVRWVLTLLLLWQIWTHSHWSVALGLTLMFMSLEAVAIALINARNKILNK